MSFSLADAHAPSLKARIFDHGSALCRYMFKYDSTHGPFKGDIEGGTEGLFINGKKIASYSKM